MQIKHWIGTGFVLFVAFLIGLIMYAAIKGGELHAYRESCEVWLLQNNYNVKIVRAENVDEKATKYIFYGTITQDCREFTTKLSPTPPKNTVWRVYWTPAKDRMWFYKL